MSKICQGENEEYLSKRKAFWTEVVEDIDRKIGEAEKRIGELQSARRTFKRNADSGQPVPSEYPTMLSGATRLP